MQLTKDELEAIKFISLKTNKDSTFWFTYNHPDRATNHIQHSGDICYQKIRGVFSNNAKADQIKIVTLGVGYLCFPKDEATAKFYDWITDPEMSPWRSIFKVRPKKITTVENDTEITKGFLLHAPSLEGVHWSFLMNFLIASRNANEFFPNINFWYELVKRDIDPAFAYFWSYYFLMEDGLVSRSNVWNANHWPIEELFDYNAFKKSEPKLKKGGFNNYYINNIWSQVNGLSYPNVQFPQKETKTQLGSIVFTHDIEEIAKYIKEREKKYGD